jgi:hypothetical protein
LSHGTPNVMNVSAYPTPMQMLFVQSAIDWVNEHETKTIVIVPEAWEFIPEGKGSPVKHSAVSLVRKGAAIGNYIWVDSQDMAGVDKVILRGCPVWLIGVQREANEIKRNLANIPASIARPTPAQIATLERGQFYVCHGSHATKTYVQPAWMGPIEANDIAVGARAMPSAAKRPNEREGTVKESEARALREENQRLKREAEELRRIIDHRAQHDHAPSSNDTAVADASRSGHRDNGNAGSTPAGAAVSLEQSLDNERLYQAIKQRLIDETPALLRVVAQKPELRVEIKRPVIDASPDSLRGRLAILIANGFFDKGVSGYAVQKEGERAAFTVSPGSLYPALNELAQLGFLSIEDPGAKKAKLYSAVPGMKVNIVELADA